MPKICLSLSIHFSGLLANFQEKDLEELRFGEPNEELN